MRHTLCLWWAVGGILQTTLETKKAVATGAVPGLGQAQAPEGNTASQGVDVVVGAMRLCTAASASSMRGCVCRVLAVGSSGQLASDINDETFATGAAPGLRQRRKQRGKAGGIKAALG